MSSFMNVFRQPRLRPWHRYAIALEDTEGHYADFAGWEHWMTEQPSRQELIEGMETVDRVRLYAVCCDSADGE